MKNLGLILMNKATTVHFGPMFHGSMNSLHMMLPFLCSVGYAVILIALVMFYFHCADLVINAENGTRAKVCTTVIYLAILLAIIITFLHLLIG